MSQVETPGESSGEGPYGPCPSVGQLDQAPAWNPDYNGTEAWQQSHDHTET